MDLYTSLIAILAVFLAIAHFKRPPRTKSASSSESFVSFQRIYLATYFLMYAADWLQGPYVYRLYAYYGFTREDNALLFIAGFAASCVMGPIAGSLADKYGRRNACLMYAITYIGSCITKHFPSFAILMFGRLLGGFATSLLWSAFEAWMVAEHNARGYDDEQLSETFGYQFAGNGFVAIACGLIAQFGVNAADGNPVVPFDMSIVTLLLGMAIVIKCWPENYGNRVAGAQRVFMEAVSSIMNDESILLTGTIQALYEGAMYSFVFMWTPVLESAQPDGVPHGFVFAIFMMSTSLGAAVFGPLSASGPPQSYLAPVFIVSGASLLIALLFPGHAAIIMCAFCVFEATVGIFWPAIGKVRATVVPEQTRTTIINIFRVPLNILVCTVLLMQSHLTPQSTFAICVACHVVCAILTIRLRTVLAAKEDRKAVRLSTAFDSA